VKDTTVSDEEGEGVCGEQRDFRYNCGKQVDIRYPVYYITKSMSK
jgi:hypothetical protein